MRSPGDPPASPLANAAARSAARLSAPPVVPGAQFGDDGGHGHPVEAAIATVAKRKPAPAPSEWWIVAIAIASVAMLHEQKR